MQQVNITDLRAHLPDFLKQVSHGEHIKITSHGKIIARLIPDTDEVEAAQKRLDLLQGTMITGDILEPIETSWSADIDNL